MLIYASVEKDKASKQAKGNYCEKYGARPPISFKEVFDRFVTTK